MLIRVVLKNGMESAPLKAIRVGRLCIHQDVSGHGWTITEPITGLGLFVFQEKAMAMREARWLSPLRDRMLRHVFWALAKTWTGGRIQAPPGLTKRQRARFEKLQEKYRV